MASFKKTVVLESELEARIIEAILKERGIPHMIKSYYDSAYDGLFQAQKGWGHVAAPEEFKEEIKDIHRGIQERNLIIDDEEPGG
jgi:ketol-acid reductoisomerase